jgi:hypothetical protein
MRTERGNWWNDRRIATARTMLADGYGREIVAMRLGVTRVALKEAIHRFNLEPPKVAR